jgi:hypothetical protein
MNLSINDIAESIEAHYEGSNPTAQDVDSRLTYLIGMLNKAYDTMEDIEAEHQSGGGMTYAIGDTLNLLELIKTKLK